MLELSYEFKDSDMIRMDNVRIRREYGYRKWYSKVMRNLVCDCFEIDYKKRPAADLMLNNIWFIDLDINDELLLLPLEIDMGFLLFLIRKRNIERRKKSKILQ